MRERNEAYDKFLKYLNFCVENFQTFSQATLADTKHEADKVLKSTPGLSLIESEGIFMKTYKVTAVEKITQLLEKDQRFETKDSILDALGLYK